MKKTVRVTPMTRQGRYPGILLQTPFSKDFILKLKTMVPFNERWFNEHKSGWWISQQYADVAVHLASEHFGGASVVDENGERVFVGVDGARVKQEQLF